ncbi:hypothetical protein AGOR_G00099810 [Albula goreensis]|uniref:creatine kinase n=1 Tax=Albula goreensis TaxID=1534307 RepID=A0A8T3DNI5_9TELE|nr:hypothetical protein AGOR_G00099810 [Albula goreensis]
MSLFNLRRLSPKEEFPNLDQNYTCMAKVLTLDMYTRQFNRATESGVIFDDIIRPGLEDPGEISGPMSVGCLAGDAQSYILFCEFFDRVIDAYHGHKLSNSQQSDFNYENLKGGDDLDRTYVLSCEVAVRRSVEGFSFPTHCSRAERRQLLTLAKKAFSLGSEDLPGNMYALDKRMQGDEGVGGCPKVDAPSDLMMRTGVARDWPDSRAVWVSKDSSLTVWINFDDHLQMVSKRTDSNIKEAFECVIINILKLEALYRKLRCWFVWKEQLGWVVSSPADVGTGLRASVWIKLQRLSQHKRMKSILERLRLRMDSTESTGVYKVYNPHTIGFSEVELLQLLVDGVKLLTVMEKRLEQPGGSIDDLVPAQK